MKRNTLLAVLRQRLEKEEGEAPQEIGMQCRIVARVPTGSGSRYLQQLCKHWSHNLAVEFTPEEGRVVFPKEGRSGTWPSEAVLTMRAHADVLECILDGSSAAHCDALTGVVQSHLDRFAFREAPLAFDWQPATVQPS